MSISNNWHCDICDKHWDHQQFSPKELCGISFERGLQVVEPGSRRGTKHVCRSCLVGIAEAVAAVSTTDYNFSKLSDYYSQERFDEGRA